MSVFFLSLSFGFQYDSNNDGRLTQEEYVQTFQAIRSLFPSFAGITVAQVETSFRRASRPEGLSINGFLAV